MITVVITRPRHPLEGRSLRVLGRMRRHGRLELLLVLPDGSKRWIPRAWTGQAEDNLAGDGATAAATLGSLMDLLGACALVGELAGRELAGQGQAARKSPSKEDSGAACPAQFDTRPLPAATGGAGRAAAGRRGRGSDPAARPRDRQSERPGRDRGGRG
ncbi:MAG TPA: DUF5372 family protein [Pseudonocardiaceae bacterium]|nr:DUF5372 family protein [Pseudonocardiaceae bacterium]